MSAHTIIDPCQADVPEDILSSTIAFAMAVRGVPIDQLMEPIRREALRQHRREQIIRTKALVRGSLIAQNVPPDPEQADYQWDHDEAEFAQEWSRT